MANPEHLEILRQGVDVWNEWRAKLIGVNLADAADQRAGRSGPNLHGANLSGANLHGADLTGTNLGTAALSGANLTGANLSKAWLFGVNLHEAKLSGANLRGASLNEANLSGAIFSEANLSDANLVGANLRDANLMKTDLRRAHLGGANLSYANLCYANLTGADLRQANLCDANLSGANLSGADLARALLIETNAEEAVLTGGRVYGVSAWNMKLEGAKQNDLVITRNDEPEVTVDNIEVAQFVYLLLHNEKIRNVIDTVGKKGVLLLGRFTEGRIVVLDRLRDALRSRGYLPIVFNFDKPETKDFTETVRLLAGLSKFVIADLTSPKSAPYELGTIVPQTMIPFQPISRRARRRSACCQTSGPIIATGSSSRSTTPRSVP